MAISEHAANSQTVGTTEHSLTTDTAGPDVDTTDGVYQVFIDFNALADGDVFEVKFYEKVQSSDTQRCFWTAAVAHDQGACENWVSPSMVLMHGWDVTLEKLSGTDRAITWSVRKVA